MIEIHFLPYGRVDAILIGVDGKWAFVDGGYRKDGKKAVAYMKSLGIEKFEAYIASHRHRNHVGAGPVVIEAMKPRVVYACHPDMEKRLLELCSGEAEERAMEKAVVWTLSCFEPFRLADAVFTPIGPDKLKRCSAGAYGENGNSLILKVEYKGRSVLLTGDTTAGILGDCPDGLLQAEVLKNPHHNRALGEKLLRRIKPNVTVVCNGKPPAKYYQKRLKAVGSELYTAGKKGDGLVVLEGDESGWRIRQTKGA